MDPILLGGLAFAVAMLLIALRMPIGFALGGVAFVATFVLYAWPEGKAVDLDAAVRPTLRLVSSSSFSFVHSYELSLVPLYIALGAIAFRTGITTDIYHAVRVWLARVPGGLGIASILGCGGFSAITGSSVACAATFGRIAVPEMLRFGYAPRFAAATVATGGTLGSLIPPSVPFVIYGIFAEQSISKLFLAGVLPGLLSMLAYIVVVVWWARVRPQDVPSPGLRFTRRDYFRAMLKAWPAALLFLIIVVGIYGGIFTATEAAAVSVAAALAIGIFGRRLSLADFKHAMSETVVQTASIFFVAIGAKMFATFIALTGATSSVVAWMGALGLSQWSLMLAAVVLYLVMGMFLDPLGILLLTLPVLVPLMQGTGIDPIWFGVIVVKMLEVGLITPPVGFNVFVLHTSTDGKVPVDVIFAGVWRFLVVEIFVVAALLAFPAVSTWLPRTMG
jgi:tripartite ATP-independent transporter DctM subunit